MKPASTHRSAHHFSVQPLARKGCSSVLAVLSAAVTLTFSAATFAHHGFGLFDRSQDAVFTGTIKSIDFVNPHSYLYFDADTEDGGTLAMRCEMRAATLMRRSGWSKEMFIPGARATIHGFRHRQDPGSCYLEEITIGDAPELNRNDQIEFSAMDVSDRPLRLPSGEPNISGDWAQEQYVIAVPPAGRSVGLVPKSMKDGIEAGTISPTDIPSAGWDAKPVTLTARGKTEFEAFEMWNPADNPRLRCEPTSIILDWVHDGPVNRVVQEKDRIVINYGLISYERVIHMNMDAHPADIEPSPAGHSIGHWEGDVLVVDTIGFQPGVIVPPLRHSEQLHVVERFSLDTENMTLKRSYVATDPAYFSDEYIGSDTLLVADVPYENHGCSELTFEFQKFQKDK
ncbi:MAG: DUF6152 family protein [Pseudomonadales bacterium]|nr:DUF6152 family protein [Pseudomonadales bacterium]